MIFQLMQILNNQIFVRLITALLAYFIAIISSDKCQQKKAFLVNKG